MKGFLLCLVELLCCSHFWMCCILLVRIVTLTIMRRIHIINLIKAFSFYKEWVTIRAFISVTHGCFQMNAYLQQYWNIWFKWTLCLISCIDRALCEVSHEYYIRSDMRRATVCSLVLFSLLQMGSMVFQKWQEQKLDGKSASHFQVWYSGRFLGVSILSVISPRG